MGKPNPIPCTFQARTGQGQQGPQGQQGQRSNPLAPSCSHTPLTPLQLDNIMTLSKISETMVPTSMTSWSAPSTTPSLSQTYFRSFVPYNSSRQSTLPASQYWLDSFTTSHTSLTPSFPRSKTQERHCVLSDQSFCLPKRYSGYLATYAKTFPQMLQDNCPGYRRKVLLHHCLLAGASKVSPSIGRCQDPGFHSIAKRPCQICPPRPVITKKDVFITTCIPIPSF